MKLNDGDIVIITGFCSSYLNPSKYNQEDVQANIGKLAKVSVNRVFTLIDLPIPIREFGENPDLAAFDYEIIVEPVFTL